MANRVYLVEPKQLTISRISEHSSSIPEEKAQIKMQNANNSVEMIRSAGDGMEFEHNREASLNSSKSPWQTSPKRPKPLATSTPSNRNRKEKGSRIMAGKMQKPESIIPLIEKTEAAVVKQNASKELEEMKGQLDALEKANQRLIEEKMKLSNQLGIQTQVNTELKTLLVASVGEDLEERLEKMTMKHALTERQIKKLQSQLDEKFEELESAVIQSDVWRSKFLASKVMSDELASWKALTDSRYRESNAALETLLEEHRQLTTTMASANRFLLKLSKLTNCPFDDESSTAFSSVDLAIMNHSLAKRVTEKILNHGLSLNSNSNSSQTPSPSTKLLSQTMEERQTFSAGERRAIKAIQESNDQDLHADKRKRDFLAHSRISQILATRYPMTCLVCRGCKGPLKII